MASATCSPRAMVSSSLSRWTSSCTDGATASRPIAKIVITAITANNVIPLSEDRLLVIAVVIVVNVFLFRRLFGTAGIQARGRLTRLETLDIVRYARNVTGRNAA